SEVSVSHDPFRDAYATPLSSLSRAAEQHRTFRANTVPNPAAGHRRHPGCAAVAGGQPVARPAMAAAARAAQYADDRRAGLADAATGQTRALTGANLNATNGPPCQWMPSSTSLLCEFIPEARGPAPVAPQTPVGPTIQETRGRAAPAATFEDLLKNAFDEQ